MGGVFSCGAVNIKQHSHENQAYIYNELKMAAKCILKLYVAGQTVNSEKTMKNLKTFSIHI